MSRVSDFVRRDINNFLFPFTNGLSLDLEQKWSPFVMGFLKVTATVASTFLIMSSAEAADALKTCACLLKECR